MIFFITMYLNFIQTVKKKKNSRLIFMNCINGKHLAQVPTWPKPERSQLNIV